MSPVRWHNRSVIASAPTGMCGWSRCKRGAEQQLEAGDAESQFLSSVKYGPCNFTATCCFSAESSTKYLRQGFSVRLIVCYITRAMGLIIM